MNPTRYLLPLAALEGLVVFSAAVRMAIPGLELDLSQPTDLAWFIAVVLVAGGALAQYVVRASWLSRRHRAGERVEESELKQVLGVSLALLGLAGLLSLAGPSLFVGLLG